MTKHATAPAETPTLAFRDETDARTRADATALLTALSRGAHPFVRTFSLHGVRTLVRQDTKLYEFIGVSEGVKRDGSIVRVGGIDFAGFDLNPVFLLAHDYTGLPIGRVIERRTEQVPGLGGAVKIVVQSASALDLGAEQRDLVRSTFALYDAGFLNTVSFGWNVLQATPLNDAEGRFSGFDFTHTDALEFSAVPVPADPQAGLQRAMEQGLLRPEQMSYFVANHKRPMRSAVYSLREMPVAAPESAGRTMADANSVAGSTSVVASSPPATRAEAIARAEEALAAAPAPDLATDTEIAAALAASGCDDCGLILVDGERKPYPWDQCMADQQAKGFDEETAKKICGSIKAKAGSAAGDADAERTADPLRWNRQLSRAFDVADARLEPATVEYELASRYIGCAVKDLEACASGVESLRMGGFLAALDGVIAARWTVDDIRKVTLGGKEAPPVHDVIALNSTRRHDFLVDGIRFMADGAGTRVVLKIEPCWWGISLTTYTKRAQADLGPEIIASAWAHAPDFLRGESFSLSGEFLTRTGDSWGDLFLDASNLQPLQQMVRLVNEKGAEIANRGQLLIGPPGCGKTCSGRVIMNEARATFIWVAARDFYRMGAFGGISYAFDIAREYAPSILFIEDIDTFLYDSAIDLLKTEMDGIARSCGVVTMLTTNYPQRLPDALLDRPGRFHDVLLFDPPSAEVRDRMLTRWLPTANDGQRAAAVAATEGYSGAHVRELATFVDVLREQDALDVGEALTRAIAKLRAQKEIIAGTHGAGSRYVPSAAVRNAVTQAMRRGTALGSRPKTASLSFARERYDAALFTSEQLRAAVTDALAGLPLLRKGAVLSQKNKDAITAAMQGMHDAISALEGVMADAMKQMGSDMPVEQAAAPVAETRMESPPDPPRSADDDDDILTRLETLEREREERRLYRDVLRGATRAQAAASTLRAKARRIAPADPKA